MDFVKYIHLERFGTDEVDGINIGECHIFPKLDGTNGSVWFEENHGVCTGSRNRILSLDDDNAGFTRYVYDQPNISKCFEEYPDIRLYGEFLVPHSLKTYRNEAWRKFYIFDVTRNGQFLHFNEYLEICKKYELDFIPCMLVAKNPTYEMLLKAVEDNKFLMSDGAGFGEGIVIKQYGWTNRFQRTTWAKLIATHFKDKHLAEMGANKLVNRMVEDDICDVYVTQHLVEKVVAKIRLEHGAFSSKNIPQLLNTVYHDLITEEMWDIVKKHKNPKIDFKTLNTCAINQVKRLLPELFGISKAA